MSVPGDVVLSEITSSALCVTVLQELKRWFPQIQDMPKWVLPALSIAWALISVILIGYEWTPHEGGGGVLMLTLPSFGAAIMAIWKWAEQFAVNEVIYRTTVKPTQPASASTTPAPAVPSASKK